MQRADIHLNYPCTLEDGFDYEELGIIDTSYLEVERSNIFWILAEGLLIREGIKIDNRMLC